MTLSISAIAGPPASTAARTTAPTGIFALSLAQMAGAPVTGSDTDPAPPGDPKAKDDSEDRQDDAVDGNALPLPTPTAPNPSLFAALLPAPVTAPVPAAAVAPKDAALTAIMSDTGRAGTVPVPTALQTASSPGPSPVTPSPSTTTGSANRAPMSTAPVPAPPAAVALAANALPVVDTATAADIVSAAPVPTLGTPPVAPPSVGTPAMPVSAIVMPSRVAVSSAPDPASIASTVVPPAPTDTGPTPMSSPVPNAAAPVLAAAIPAPSPTLPTAPATVVPIVAVVAPVSTTGIAVDPVQPAAVTSLPATDTPAVAGTIQIDSRSAPVVALSPAMPTVPVQGAAGSSTTTTSAIQAFGAAMRAGLAKGPRPEAGADGTTGTLAGSAALRTDQTPAVAATGDTQQAPMDLRREQWPHAMIDRIEALRDAADATSTKIRVVPDALGPIEMSVRKDGDTLHVHFTADQAATRAILTDAQPRLAAIAEQRGLRLGGSTVDGGSTNAGAGQQQQQATTRQPTAPAPSSTLVAAAAADDDDTRIA